MRFLELTNDFPPNPMFGAGIHVADLVKGLAENGHRALVATRKADGPVRRTLHGGLVEVVNAGERHDADSPLSKGDHLHPRWFMADRLAYNHALLGPLDESESGFDIVHNHDPIMVPLACEAAEANDAPLLTTVHLADVVMERSGVSRPRWIDRHVMRALELEGYRRSSLILAPSEATAGLLRDEYPWCADKVAVVELPCGDRPSAKTSYEMAGPAQILVVSRLDPNKGLVPLIQALGELPPGTVECTVIGAGGMRERLREAAAAAGVTLHFRGALPREEVLGAYREADLLVAPSPLETYGLVLQEAMGAGLPVVATDIPAFTERIDDGVNGLLVPVASGEAGLGPDVSAVAAAVRRLIASADLRRDLGKAAREREIKSTRAYADEIVTTLRAMDLDAWQSA
ncbi:glycosyltransferase family 4 protein [Glycomyces artemisiae]|uniref:Glycosyltransferase involved in cell wall biosynthesis n=1 Tax=Glycomyces artemisiae TaxID=1076443 RepID=A0A2T0UX87_9ACTN|nr:glycosyltransferase family 4 protein [Glycomyces artemisiae]PRY62541.1 glycosyltransferase involved in cell wall biosynthesis [Glycomyces artemisiae]